MSVNIHTHTGARTRNMHTQGNANNNMSRLPLVVREVGWGGCFRDVRYVFFCWQP